MPEDQTDKALQPPYVTTAHLLPMWRVVLPVDPYKAHLVHHRINQPMIDATYVFWCSTMTLSGSTELVVKATTKASAIVWCPNCLAAVQRFVAGFSTRIEVRP